jgi:acyl-CoA thioester hydrolase
MEINQSTSLKKLIHSTEYSIRWGDMDAFSHVNNTMYFLYVQEARIKMMLENNIANDPRGIVPVLAETSCKFIRPITFPERLLINTYMIKVEGKKAFFEHELKSSSKPDILYAIVLATVVWFDFKAASSCEIPQYIIELSSKK